MVCELVSEVLVAVRTWGNLGVSHFLRNETIDPTLMTKG